MTTRDKILSTLRANAREVMLSGLKTDERYEMPDMSVFSPIEYEDPVAKFIETAKTVSGANVIELDGDDDIDIAVRNAYPDANLIASHLTDVKADMNPDTVETAQELMKVDVGVIEGKIGVAENGCIWIPQTMKEKAVCFASEYLVILLRRADIVSNMHEAYRKIDETPEYFEPYKFGTFISGPSKTADIESALVYGAQAARGVTILLI